MEIKVLMADEHRLFREAVASMLSDEPGIEIAGEVENGRELLEMVREVRPDVVTSEVRLPGLNGIEATRQITREFPSVRVIALSTQLDQRSVQEMLKAGAAGYVPKVCGFTELLSAVKSVAGGHTYLSPQISNIVARGYVNQSNGKEVSAFLLLTPRNREVLQLIAEGNSTKKAAKQLHVSTKTIEWHRSQLMGKLGVDSVAGLVKYAIYEGLVADACLV